MNQRDSLGAAAVAGLPEELLLGGVLARLPIDLARCRCVCRLWNTFITSARFDANYSRSHKLLLVFNGSRGKCCAYSPDYARWYSLSRAGPPAAWCSHIPLTAAGSLLVYDNFPTDRAFHMLDRAHQHRNLEAAPALRLAVCNPLTGCSLPQSNRSPSTEVYDSSSDTWSMSTEMMPEDFTKALTDGNWEHGGVCCDGILYCLGAGTCIRAYELASGVWRKDLVFDVERGMWDRLKWTVECYAQRLYLTMGGSGRGLFLTAIDALNVPHVCIMGLPYCGIGTSDSSLIQWAEDIVHQPPDPPLNMINICTHNC